MSTRLAAHLRRNRHDVFYFRQAVPADLAPLFATREIYKTLATRDRLEARQRALVIAVKIDALFRNLRLMSKKKPADVVRAELKVILDFDPLKGLTQATVHAEPNEEQMADRLVPRLLHAARGTAPIASGEAVVAEVRLTELIERYCREQAHWKSQSRDDIRGDLLQIAAVAGDPLSTQLSRPMLSEVQATLLKLPSNLNKLPEFAGKSFDEVIALERPPQSPTTVRKKWGRLIAFLNWARAHGFVAENVASGMKPKAKHQSYAKFTEPDLKRLFESREYMGGTFDEAFKYWLPILGLFTGARLEELCQLHLADVRDAAEVPHLKITEEIDSEKGAAGFGKSVKTHEPRKCPIHPQLVALGLLEYVRALRAQGHDRMFPELQPDAGGKVGGRASEWFTEYRRKVGVGEAAGARSRKTFHSFRHTVIHQLQHAGVPQDVREQLAGHKSKSINVAVYGGQFDLTTLAGHLAKLRFDVELAPYRTSDAHESARQWANNAARSHSRRR